MFTPEVPKSMNLGHIFLLGLAKQFFHCLTPLPKLREVFEVNDISDDGDNDFSQHYLPNFRRQSFAGKSDSTFYNIWDL